MRTPTRQPQPAGPPTRPSRRSRRARVLLAACTLALSGILAGPGVAAALTQRGHYFTTSFGASELSDPGQIAVSASNHDLYILDRGHARIVQYSPTGQFLAAWGWGVKQGSDGKQYEVCDGGECNAQGGIPGRGKYQLNANAQIAVDNCTQPSGEPCTTTEDPSVGDVYVLAESAAGEEAKKLLREESEHPGQRFYSEYAAVDKLTGQGQPLERTPKEEFFYASSETETNSKGKTKPLAGEEYLESEEAHGIAVGPHGTLWLASDEELFPISDHGFAKARQSEGVESRGALSFELALEGEPAPGLALDSRGRFYIPQRLPGPAGTTREVFSAWASTPGPNGQPEPELLELTPALVGQQTVALAVNPLDVPANDVDEQDDVYLANPSGEGSEATSTLTELSSDGQQLQQLSAPGLQQAAGVAVDPLTGTVYVSDAARGLIDVFPVEPPGAPSVDDLSVQDVLSVSAQLDGSIDPHGAPTTYAFRYSTAAVPAAGEPCNSPCVEDPQPQAALGESFAQSAVNAKPTLTQQTTYHYRLIATNPHGSAESSERSFSTTAAAGRFIADQRVWELVSPPQKSGAEIEPLTRYGGAIQAAADGQALTYIANSSVGETHGSRSFEVTQMLSCSPRLPACAAAGAGGWSSQDIVTPNEHGTGVYGSPPPEYQLFSQNLSLALVQPPFPLGRFAEPPLSPPLTGREASEGLENTIYLRADEPLSPEGQAQATLYDQAAANGTAMHQTGEGYLALVNDRDVLEGTRFGSFKNGNGEEFEAALTLLDAIPDLSTVVLSSEVALTGESQASPDPSDLYAYSGGTLQLLSVLPDGQPASQPTLGQDDQNMRNAISSDATRFFWSSRGHLYVRDTRSAQTLQLDGENETQEGAAVFQAASTDGSKVFFTDTQPLTEGSGAKPSQPDLYVCELREDAATGALEACTAQNHRLADLTPAHAGESADVRGVVLGVSEDGSYVYFVADGVLASGAAPGGCDGESDAERAEQIEHGATPPGYHCNLYVAHDEAGAWASRLIASLSEEDAPDWEAQLAGTGDGELAEVTARVSASGRYLAFMSDRSLTSFDGVPYDNRATDPAAHGAPAEEVYLYDADSEHVLCASCDPSGARPKGILDPPEGTVYQEGQGLLVDRPGIWAGRWLAGSIPGWTRISKVLPPRVLYQSRYLSDSGRLYFDSPDDLLPEATNAKEDVYEYEPTGIPAGPLVCQTDSPGFDSSAQGCLGLISSGTSSRESAFLDASETGGEGSGGEQLAQGGSDVFFITAAPLVPQDTDSSFDVYDAHECTGSSPCVTPPELQTPEVCETTRSCRAPAPPAGALGQPASAPPGAPGNTSARQQVLPSKTETKPKTKPKPLRRAQKLAKALRACRSAHRHAAKRRASCERDARRRYGPVKHNNNAHRSRVRASAGRSR